MKSSWCGGQSWEGYFRQSGEGRSPQGGDFWAETWIMTEKSLVVKSWVKVWFKQREQKWSIKTHEPQAEELQHGNLTTTPPGRHPASFIFIV